MTIINYYRPNLNTDWKRYLIAKSRPKHRVRPSLSPNHVTRYRPSLG